MSAVTPGTTWNILGMMQLTPWLQGDEKIDEMTSPTPTYCRER